MLDKKNFREELHEVVEYFNKAGLDNPYDAGVLHRLETKLEMREGEIARLELELREKNKILLELFLELHNKRSK